MNVLFTKKGLDRKLISQLFGDRYSYDFTEVIKINALTVEPFALKNYSLIFTSVNGVDSFFDNGFHLNEVFTEKDYNKVYVVGPKTKNALRKRGFGTFKVCRHAQELSEFLVQNAQGERLLHFCGNLSLDILDPLRPLQNIQYRKIPVYETQLLYPKVQTPYDAVVFFSPSGVRSFIAENSIDNKILFTIGHTTQNELEKHTHLPIYASEESNFQDLMEVIVNRLNKL